jgi:uncharacterized protein involved in exopolysaccharide biosynthesis
MSELESGFRIGDVIAMIARRWPVVVGSAVVGLIAGYLVYASAPTTYSATSRVQVKPFGDAFSSDGKVAEVDMGTEKDLVKSDAVADAIRAEVGLTGENRAILSRIVVLIDPEGNSDVMAITFEGDAAKQTQDAANAAAAGYLDARKATAKASADTANARLDEEIKTASANLDAANAAVNGTKSGTPERAQAQARAQAASSALAQLQAQQVKVNQFDPSAVGTITRKASLPDPVTSKMALGKAVGVFGLFVLAGLAAAWFLDRRDGLGGGRRRVEALLPNASIRVMPGAEGGSATPAEIDTAIDRLAVELVAGGTPGRASSVLIIGAGMEPPVALAEELASSLAFAGIPALFVLAGSTDRQLRSAHTVPSFADLVTSGASVSGPAGLPAQAGDTALSTGPLVTWLRPKGSPEAAGLLRRADVDSLVSRAARERFEAVVFVAPSPSRTAAGSALGQWVGRTALVVGSDERAQAEAAAAALADADVRVTEVVWT